MDNVKKNETVSEYNIPLSNPVGLAQWLKTALMGPAWYVCYNTWRQKHSQVPKHYV